MDDLDAALENLDIDNDFNMSILGDKASGDEDDDDLEESEMGDVRKWQKRLFRDNVFSKRYKPTKDEAAEVHELGKYLGVDSITGTIVVDNALNSLIKADQGLHSIILKRGPIKMDGANRELIIMTHGFVVAKLKSGGMFDLMTRPYDSSGLYDDVKWIRDIWQIEDKHQFRLLAGTLSGTREILFETDSPVTKQAWMQAFERVLFENRSHQSSEQRALRDFGWQHELVQTSIYTAAVTGQAFFGESHLEDINTPDEYNKLTPLHYAAMYNQVHIIQHLVEKGADMELEDEEGRTPIYYGEYLLH